MRHPLHVLVVDDSELIVSKIKELLTEVPDIDSVQTANNADHALQKIKNHTPDLILLDLNMPGKNGVDLLQDIKHDYPSTKVIIVSSHANQFYRGLCKDIGADNFIDKLTEFEKIPSLIKNLSKPAVLN